MPFVSAEELEFSCVSGTHLSLSLIITIRIRFIKPLWLCKRGFIIRHHPLIFRDLVLDTILLRLCPFNLSGSLNTGESSDGFLGLSSSERKLIRRWQALVSIRKVPSAARTTIFIELVDSSTIIIPGIRDRGIELDQTQHSQLKLIILQQ